MLIPKPYQKLTVNASALIARNEGQFTKGDLVHAEYKGTWREATVQKTVKQGTAFEVKIHKPYQVTVLPANKLRLHTNKTKTVTRSRTVPIAVAVPNRYPAAPAVPGQAPSASVNVSVSVNMNVSVNECE